MNKIVQSIAYALKQTHLEASQHSAASEDPETKCKDLFLAYWNIN